MSGWQSMISTPPGSGIGMSFVWVEISDTVGRTEPGMASPGITQ